jgi:cytochrome c oxidase assembly protein subunit 15
MPHEAANASITWRSERSLPRFAWFAVFYNVLVVLWGALVRASGSGAGCGNHWPLCNGQVIPVSPGFHTVIEFTHRMMTGPGDSIVIIALLIWTICATAKRDAARFFAIATTVLLINEAFLGALLVKLGYVTDNQSVGRMVVLSIHFSNTLLLLAALTLTAWSLSHIPNQEPQDWRTLHRARGFGWAVAGLVATILVGVSGSMAALGDTLFPASSLSAAFAQDFAASSPMLLRLRILHPVCALLAALFVLWLIAPWLKGRSRTPTLATRAELHAYNRRVSLVVVLLVLQFALGIADVLLLAPAWMQLLHLLGADLYWVALVLLAAETVWPPVAAPAPSDSATPGITVRVA